MGRGNSSNLLYQQARIPARSQTLVDCEKLLLSSELENWTQALLKLYHNHAISDLNKLTENFYSQLYQAAYLTTLPDEEATKYYLDYSFISFLRKTEFKDNITKKKVPWIKAIRKYQLLLSSKPDSIPSADRKLIKNTAAQADYNAVLTQLAQSEKVIRYTKPDIIVTADKHYCLKTISYSPLCGQKKPPVGKAALVDFNLETLEGIQENPKNASTLTSLKIEDNDYNICPECLLKLPETDLRVFVRPYVRNESQLSNVGLLTVKTTTEELLPQIDSFSGQQDFEEYLISKAYLVSIERLLNQHDSAVNQNLFYSGEKLTEQDKQAYRDLYQQLRQTGKLNVNQLPTLIC